MNDSVRPVSFSEFSKKNWKPFTNYKFAEGSLICPVSGEELGHLANAFPLGFLDDERTSMVAIMGLTAGKNLFVAPDGKWVGTYIPSILRGYPFKLLTAANDQLALGYDTASGLLVGEGEGERFFNDTGQPTDRIKETLQFLVRVKKGEETVAHAAKMLGDAGVLESWPIKVRDGEREIPVEGLLRVSEQKFRELGDEAFLALRRSGALSVAYAQLQSTVNLVLLGQLAQVHARHAEVLNKQQQEVVSMFEPVSGAEEELDWDAILKDK